ncbi:MAG: hypothetical protein FWB78_03715 [Treponema sp.]|nr:hypothetical protein [Treponema sp.]
MRRIPFILLAILTLALIVSCSRTEPRIAFGYIGLVYYQEVGGPQERFSFFIIPEDDDGIENLADLFLYHDREQLRWHISSDEWVRYERDGRTWIGTRAIAIGAGETMPRGQYRAVLVNLGGERSERNFTFDAPETPRFAFPTLNIADGNFTVVSGYPVNRLVSYDEQGNFLSTVELTSLSGTIASLNLPSNARLAALWAEDALHFTSAFTDVVPIR